MNTITVSGKAGSGKTTVARELSGDLNLKYLSMGRIFSELAKERGMTLSDFSKYAESNKDIDLEIDGKQKEYAKKGNIVIEGRLSGHIIDSADLKIWLAASLDERVKRIIGREKRNYDDVLEETKTREESEKKRYYKYYQIDIDDLDKYDVIINTQKWSAKEIIDIVKSIYLKSGGKTND